MPDQVLQANGVCKVCEKSAADKSFPCSVCDKIWHVYECTGPDLITKTCLSLLKPWKANGTYPSVCFLCPPCLDAKNLHHNIVASNRVTVLEESITDIKQDILAIKNHVLTEQPRIDNVNFPPLQQPSKPSDSVLVVKKPADKPSADREMIKAAVINSRVAVSSTYVNKRGDTVMILDNEASKDRLAANLRETVGPSEIVLPVSRMPTIRITGMDENFTPQAVFDSAKELNSDRGINIDNNNFKVLFIRPHSKDPKKFQATVRVSNQIRVAIDHGDNKLFVGLNRCPIYDHFHVKRCNLCQGYNHYKTNKQTKEDCKKAPVCGKCSGPHETDTCRVTEFKCVHCVENKHDSNHQTSDPNCPSYLVAQKKLEKSIGFYKKKN